MQSRLNPQICLGFVLAAVPAALAIHVAYAYYDPLPYAEDWLLAPILKNIIEGDVRFSDFWSPVNGHYLLAPRLILVPLALLTGWDKRWELGVVLLLVLASFILVSRRTAALGRETGEPGLALLIPAFSLLFFSLIQFEYYIMGFMVQYALYQLCILGYSALMISSPLSWKKTTAAALCAATATTCVSGGFLLWYLGIPLILIASRLTWRAKLAHASMWITAALAMTLACLPSLQSGPQVKTDWTEFITFALVFLGVPVSGYSIEFAYWMGMFGLAIFFLTSFTLFFRRLAAPRTTGFFLVIGIHTAGLAILAAQFRSGLGIKMAFASHYVPFSSMLWIANFVLLLLLAHKFRSAAHPIWESIVKTSAVLILVGCILLSGMTSLGTLPEYPNLQECLSLARSKLIENKDNAWLRGTYKGTYVRPMNEIAREYGLGFYRHLETDPSAHGPVPAGQSRPAEQ